MAVCLNVSPARNPGTEMAGKANDFSGDGRPVSVASQKTRVAVKCAGNKSLGRMARTVRRLIEEGTLIFICC